MLLLLFMIMLLLPQLLLLLSMNDDDIHLGNEENLQRGEENRKMITKTIKPSKRTSEPTIAELQIHQHLRTRPIRPTMRSHDDEIIVR